MVFTWQVQTVFSPAHRTELGSECKMLPNFKVIELLSPDPASLEMGEYYTTYLISIRILGHISQDWMNIEKNNNLAQNFSERISYFHKPPVALRCMPKWERESEENCNRKLIYRFSTSLNSISGVVFQSNTPKCTESGWGIASPLKLGLMVRSIVPQLFLFFLIYFTSFRIGSNPLSPLE